MPMEQARCPECGSPIGGRNHAARACLGQNKWSDETGCYFDGGKSHPLSFRDGFHKSLLNIAIFYFLLKIIGSSVCLYLIAERLSQVAVGPKRNATP